MATYRRTPAYAGYGPGLAVARIISLVTAGVVGLIVIGILLHVLGASTHSEVVRWIEHAGSWLSSPFHGAFSVHGNWSYVVNWGLAALVYGLAGGFIARAVAR
jgi:hypothetical protein